MRLPPTAGCRCCALRYGIARVLKAVYTCHCTNCQRLTGSAFSMGLVVAAGALRLTGADPRPFRRTADSGRTVTGWLCPECGARVCGGSRPGPAAPANALCTVRTGTLDDASWLQPTFRFCSRGAQSWVVLPPGGRSFEAEPADFGWMRPPPGP